MSTNAFKMHFENTEGKRENAVMKKQFLFFPTMFPKPVCC